MLRSPLPSCAAITRRAWSWGTFAALAAFVLSDRATAWRWAQNAKVLQVPFRDAPLIQICGSVVFGLTIPLRTRSPAERDAMASGSAPLPCRLARVCHDRPDADGPDPWGDRGGTASGAATRYRVVADGPLCRIPGASLAPDAATWRQVNHAMAQVGSGLLGGADLGGLHRGHRTRQDLIAAPIGAGRVVHAPVVSPRRHASSDLR